jgi:hypothetical protein
MDESSPPYRPRCIHLSCKAMLVFGEAFENDPEVQAGMADFWCGQTSKGQGPDGEGVGLTPCTDSERPCFRAY